MTKRDVWFLLLGALLSAGLLYFFRRPLQRSSSDPGYVASLGILERLIGIVILCLIVVVTTLGTRTVGAVLTSASLLLPCVAALQCARTPSAMPHFAVAMAVRSALLGCAVSTNVIRISIGPMTIVCMGVFTLAVFLSRSGKERG